MQCFPHLLYIYDPTNFLSIKMKEEQKSHKTDLGIRRWGGERSWKYILSKAENCRVIRTYMDWGIINNNADDIGRKLKRMGK